METRRFTRLTNAFSKKWEKHHAALALFAYYDFCGMHKTLRSCRSCLDVERPAYSKMTTKGIEREARETDELLRKALRLGIDIPPNPDWWWDQGKLFARMSSDQFDDMVRSYLSEQGKAGVRRLIRDERRKSAEWWIKLVAFVVALVTGLLGALIGVLAFLKK